jgi:hypothetical protein
LQLNTHKIYIDYVEGIQLEALFYEALKQQDKTKLIASLALYRKLIELISTTAQNKDWRGQDFFQGVTIKNVRCLPYGGNIDLTMNNIFIKNNVYFIIDPEFVVYKPIPINFVIAVNLIDLQQKYADKITALISEMDLLHYFGLTKEEFGIYRKMYKQLQDYIKRGFYAARK